MSETSRSAIISTHDLARRSTFLQNVCHLAHIFQLTTSRGGRPEAMSALALHLHFNSRPHEEVDIIHHNTIESMYKYFNSRPRKEWQMETTEHELDISTHDLARRSTVPHDPETGLLIISTHDLTRRSTKSNASTILNGVNFNSRSHKEVDFHARRCVLCRICISTHDLTKRSTNS